MVAVECKGQKKYTKALDDIGTSGIAHWGEHIFFEFKNQEVDEVEAAKIKITVQDKRVLKNAVIGIYEFDLTYIYF